MTDHDIREYFAGKKLYGDDFSKAQIDAWFKDEQDGYYSTIAKSNEDYAYEFHIFNIVHGFSKLPKNGVWDKVLSFGGAFGDELIPIIGRAGRAFIIEASANFAHSSLRGKPLAYVKPDASGKIAFEDGTFDIITCFGVLHHIPNVSYVLSELHRVLKPGGYLLLREPTISLGDWRKPRIGLTKRERGIPLDTMDESIKKAGFSIVSRQHCMNTAIYMIGSLLRIKPFKNKFMVFADMVISKLFLWNTTYHARDFYIRNTSCFYVLYSK